jgi:hypothetical protein
VWGTDFPVWRGYLFHVDLTAVTTGHVLWSVELTVAQLLRNCTNFEEHKGSLLY